MKPQLLIFDLDGTLIDSRRDLAMAVNLMRAHYSLPPLPEEQIGTYVGDGVRKLVERSLAGTSINGNDAVAIQRARYREHLCDATTLYPGVEKGLRRLHQQGHRLVVATNKPVEFTDIILDHFGIRSLFAAVHGDGNTPRLKPHPDPILDLMRRLNGLPESTWVIGDHHTDMESARRAGVHAIFVTYGIGNPGSFTPENTAATFDEVVALFAP